jgi:hypothetical protein
MCEANEVIQIDELELSMFSRSLLLLHYELLYLPPPLPPRNLICILRSIPGQILGNCLTINLTSPDYKGTTIVTIANVPSLPPHCVICIRRLLPRQQLGAVPHDYPHQPR